MMYFETNVSECKKYVHTVVTTDITFDIAIKLMQRACDEASRHDIRNYFFDFRRARNLESTLNNYRLVNEVAPDIGCERTVKIAILISLHDDSHDFLETAALGAGMNCKIFTSQDSLLEWIKI